MRHSVDATDFRKTNNLLNRTAAISERKGRTTLLGPCWVCEKYDLHENKVVAQYSQENSEKWRGFDPLKETPDLFFKFSRLHRERNFAQAALIFGRQYGLPCATSRQESSVYAPPEELTLRRFFDESQRAWVIVSLYEAVLNRNEEAAKHLLTDYHHLDRSFRLRYEDLTAESSPDRFRYTPLQAALSAAVSAVDLVVKISCASSLTVLIDNKSQPDPADVTHIWYFNDLRGAMHLQMYWLLTSGGNLTRCEHCMRIISLSRPYPEGRKRRRDKRFCDDACRQAHHRAKKD